MNAFYERSLLGQIECNKLLGNFDLNNNLIIKYNIYKERLKPKKHKMQKYLKFEGTLVAVGWDSSDNVNQASLFNDKQEDVLLDHHLGIEKFKPFFNLRVRLYGHIVSRGFEGLRVLVKQIYPLWEKNTFNFPKPTILQDEPMVEAF